MKERSFFLAACWLLYRLFAQSSMAFSIEIVHTPPGGRAVKLHLRKIERAIIKRPHFLAMPLEDENMVL